MFYTLLAAGDQLIKLSPPAILAWPAKENQREDGGGYQFLNSVFSLAPEKAIFMF